MKNKKKLIKIIKVHLIFGTHGIEKTGILIGMFDGHC